MAKKSMIAREKKRTKMVAKYAAKRTELKALIANPNTDFDQKMEAVTALQNLPQEEVSSCLEASHRYKQTDHPDGR